MEFTDILKSEASFRYQMLDRMKMDCEYFLGGGNRCEKYLWGGEVTRHIDYMKALWNSFTEKPLWLTMEQICKYEAEMK